MSVEIVERRALREHRTVLLDQHEHVWLTFARPWWDLASWFWFWLSPGTKKWMVVRCASGKKVRIRAIRISRKVVRMGDASKDSS